MNTGFNTDVDHQGRVFHVQTEDKGLDNPVVESLLYCKGEIVISRRSSYEELAGSPDYSEAEVQHRMEMQHQALIRDIKNGKFDTEVQMPFGSKIVTNRSFDDVVIAFLNEMVEEQRIRIEMLDHQVLFAGTRPTLRLKVMDAAEQPVPAAQVRIRLVTEPDGQRELFAAATDDEGFLEASFEIPDNDVEGVLLRCEADLQGRHAELTQQVRPGGGSAQLP